VRAPEELSDVARRAGFRRIHLSRLMLVGDEMWRAFVEFDFDGCVKLRRLQMLKLDGDVESFRAMAGGGTEIDAWRAGILRRMKQGLNFSAFIE
jgi:hypothetical protein